MRLCAFGVDAHLRAIVGDGLPVRALLGQGVGTQIRQRALKTAVDRVIKRIELDRHWQAGAQLADVGRVDLHLEHHLAFGRRDLHQLIAGAQYAADGGELEVFNNTGNRCRQYRLAEDTLPFIEFVTVRRKIFSHFSMTTQNVSLPVDIFK